MSKLLLVAYAALAVAWLFSDPPGAGPDEPANYMKAVAAGHGQLLGKPGALPQDVASKFRLTGPRYPFANSTTRWVSVPPNLAPIGFACNAFNSSQPAACVNQAGHPPVPTLQPTYTGTYEPFVYLLPGIISRLAGNATAALLLMRTSIALLSLLLLGFAISLLADRKVALSLMGLLIAATPELVWLTGIVNASGPEVCAGVCFFAGILRLARSQQPSRNVWVALMVSGTVLAIGRPLGPVWVCTDLLLLLLISGPPTAWRRLSEGGWLSRATAGVVLSAVALGVGWERIVEPRQLTAFTEFWAQLPQTMMALPQDLQEGIGVFGWLDTFMPSAAYIVWVLVFSTVFALAIRLGTPRQRLNLLIVLFLTISAALVLAAAVLAPSGFNLQGRYVLPLAVSVPLYAGEIVYRNRDRLTGIARRYPPGAAAVAMAALQIVGWFTNSLREAVGTSGPLAFWVVSKWSPPLGWLPWFAMVGGGCVAIIAAAASTGTDDQAASASSSDRVAVAGSM